MATIAKLAVMLSANTAAFTSEMNKAGKVIDQTSNKAAAAFGRSAGIDSGWGRSFMDEVKRSERAARSMRGAMRGLGEDSEKTTNILQLLKGGGAAAGLAFVAKKLNAGLDEVAATMAKVHAGELTMAEGMEEAAASMARAIPVVGAFFEAGQNIAAILSGTAQAIADFDAMLRNRASAEQQASATSQNYASSLVSLQSQLVSTRRQIALLSATEEDRPKVQASFDLSDTLAQVAAARKAADALANTPGFKQESSDIRAYADALEQAAQMRDNLTRTQIDAAAQAQNKKEIEELTSKIANFGKTPLDALLERVGKTEGPAAVAFVQQLIDKLNKLETAKAGEDKIKGIFAGLEQQFATIGTPAEQLAASLRDAGASDEQIAKAARLQKTYEGLTARAKERADMEERAKQIMEETLTPAEKFAKERERVAELLERQLITQEAYDRKVSALRKDMEQPKAPADAGRFAQIDISRVNVAGLAPKKNEKQKVEDPQLVKTNELLEKMSGKFVMGVAG